MNDSDVEWYKRRESERVAKQKWPATLNDDIPRRKEILERVRRGEITLREGQKIIRKDWRKAHRVA